MNLTINEYNDKIVIYDKDAKGVKIQITKKLFIPTENNFFFLKQTHSDKYVFISNINDVKEKRGAEGDSVISVLKNFPVAIKTADCLPVFIYSDNSRLIAVCHAGWRGTAVKNIVKVLDFITKNLHFNKNELNFIMGVSICEKCYEIKDDMLNAFLRTFGENGRKYFQNGRFNLKQANMEIIENYGIEKKRIFNLKKCTVCNNSDYFSYRRERTKKRIINSIELINC